jgi:hypothetical protein
VLVLGYTCKCAPDLTVLDDTVLIVDNTSPELLSTLSRSFGQQPHMLYQ